MVTALDPSTSGTLTSQWSTASNTSTPGRLVISAASAMALSGSGTLIELQFRGVAPGETSLTFAEVTLNEGDPAADAVDGGVTVSGSTDVAGGPEPFSFEVAPPYPNPTAGGVVVRVYSDLDQDASVQVFDVTGRAVSVLDVVRLSAGAATTVRLASGDLPGGHLLRRRRFSRAHAERQGGCGEVRVSEPGRVEWGPTSNGTVLYGRRGLRPR